VSESMETTSPVRTGVSTKARTLAIGALATMALSIPAVSAVSFVSHDAWRAPVIRPASHRLALGHVPESLRLT